AVRRRRPSRLVDRRRPQTTRRDRRAPGLPRREELAPAVRAASERLPAQPLRRAAVALARIVASPRPELLPRAAGYARLSRIRPRLCRAASACGAPRSCPGHTRRDARAR